MSPARLVFVAARAFLRLRPVALAILLVALASSAAYAGGGRYASIVIDADSGVVLHASNPDKRSYPASLTKVMTLYLLFEALDDGRLRLDQRLPVSAHASAQAPSKLNLEPGDHISVEEVVMALVTKSANDAAVVAAEAIGGSESGFAQMMTRKARELGMSATTYRNASGLPDLGQTSTVRDQATLARALIRDHGRYYHYFSTRAFSWHGQTIPTHNRLMLRYAGADGIKTGYIHASGFNLIASAKRDGKRVIGVVFGGSSAPWRDSHMATLLDKGFARLNKGEVVTAAAEENDTEDEPAPAKPKAVKAKPVKAKLAAVKARARDDDEEEAGDAGDPDWSIQVGAFNAYKPAHQAASSAAKKLGGLIYKASIDIDKAKQGKHTLFRARITGFSEDQARAACKKLARASKSCKVVQPSA